MKGRTDGAYRPHCTVCFLSPPPESIIYFIGRRHFYCPTSGLIKYILCIYDILEVSAAPSHLFLVSSIYSASLEEFPSNPDLVYINFMTIINENGECFHFET